MAFNIGMGSKDAFKELRKLTPQKRVDYVNQQGAATLLTMLTPAEFAELFPKYYQKGLPDVGGFREAISRKSRQKQEDINYGLSQGARSLDEAERLGASRSRNGGEEGSTASRRLGGSFSAANYVAILKQAGFNEKDAKLMAAVGMQESNGNVGAHNDANPNRERSYGLFQININAHDFNSPEMRYAGVTSVQDLYDPLKNAKVAYYLYYKTSTGINHWGGYTDGGYKKYLSAAEAAAGTPAGIPSSQVSEVSSKSGGFYGNDQQCVALSKHFSGLGAASGWKVKSGNIVPGSVIATMSYNDGTGGKMAKDMPDGKSHYHTGIALSKPNENGDVLILEQFAGQPARVRSININNYNGEKWGVVEGGDPNAGTMKAVEIGKGLANQDQLAWIQSSTGAPVDTAGKPTVEVKPTQQAGVAKPTLTTNEQAPQYPEQQQQQATTETAKVEKPDKSKKTYQTYKFDPDKYYNEVDTKHPEAKMFGYDRATIMKETYKGFEDAQAAGAIKWNKKTNEIQVLDPNHEAIQKIYKDMQSNNIDRNVFLTQSEAGGSGTAKVNRVHKQKAAMHQADVYSPEVSASGLSKESKLVDYEGSLAADEIGVSKEQFNAFREAKASIESSGGTYPLRGGSSDRFSGAYQMGGEEIKAAAAFLKEEAPVMKMKGKRKTVANEDFLNDPSMQERYHEAYTLLQHRQLMKNKKYAAMSPDERLQVLGVAHNAGAGGASHWLRTGKVKNDAFGTHPEKYASRIGKQLAGLQTAKAEEAASKVKVASQTAEPVMKNAGEKSSTEPNQQNRTFVQKAKAFLGLGESVAEPMPQQPAPGTSTKETFDRMRQLSTPTPAQKPLPDKMDIAPTNDKAIQDYLMQHPVEPEIHSQNVPQEKLQSPVVVDSFMKQHTTGFMSPSLERAMNRTRGHESDMNANRINTGTSIS